MERSSGGRSGVAIVDELEAISLGSASKPFKLFEDYASRSIRKLLQSREASRRGARVIPVSLADTDIYAPFCKKYWVWSLAEIREYG
jgi:hypothetical protein